MEMIIRFLRWLKRDRPQWRPARLSYQMCRKINGEWQYRPMTDEEIIEEWRDRQW